MGDNFAHHQYGFRLGKDIEGTVPVICLQFSRGRVLEVDQVSGIDFFSASVDSLISDCIFVLVLILIYNSIVANSTFSSSLLMQAQAFNERKKRFNEIGQVRNKEVLSTSQSNFDS